MLALAGCNFRIDNGWMSPAPKDGAIDATTLRLDAGAEAGQDMASWCRAECAAGEDRDECSDQVICADAAVCADEPPCEVCSRCRDE